MDILVILAILFIVSAVCVAVTAPLRAARDVEGPDAPEPRETRADLEAAREAKYREIRDAEMDFRTGKLSDADYRELDTALRAEALEILDRLERMR